MENPVAIAPKITLRTPSPAITPTAPRIAVLTGPKISTNFFAPSIMPPKNEESFSPGARGPVIPASGLLARCSPDFGSTKYCYVSFPK